MHTLVEVSPGVVLSIDSAVKPKPRILALLLERVHAIEPGLAHSVRDPRSGFWFRATKLTEQGPN